MSRLTRVLVVVVAYGVNDRTRACLSTLEMAADGCDGLEVELRFVQNLPTAPILSLFGPVKSRRVHITNLSNENLGYLGAALSCVDKTEPPDWLVVCNSDLVFPGDFFSLFRGVPTACGVLAPQVIELRNEGLTRPVNPHMLTRPTTAALMKIAVANSSRYAVLASSLLRKWRLTSIFPYEHTKATGRLTSSYAVHGSCFALSRELLQGSEYLRGHPFLYAEELFVGEAALRLGLQVMTQDTVSVQHVAHADTGAGFRTRAIARLQRQGTWSVVWQLLSQNARALFNTRCGVRRGKAMSADPLAHLDGMDQR